MWCSLIQYELSQVCNAINGGRPNLWVSINLATFITDSFLPGIKRGPDKAAYFLPSTAPNHSKHPELGSHIDLSSMRRQILGSFNMAAIVLSD